MTDEQIKTLFEEIRKLNIHLDALNKNILNIPSALNSILDALKTGVVVKKE